MNLQIIKSIDGKAEYVLLPISLYQELQQQIDTKIKIQSNDYVPFDPADYVKNPIALARIKAHLTQAELAELLNVTQAYISKIERQKKVTAKLLNKVREAILSIKK